MTKCELHEFPCIDVKYEPFDIICAGELALPISADIIINRSEFCTLIPINGDFRLDGLSISDYLKGLKGKMGIYHLWINYDECDDHARHTMLGVYVGKGAADGRILSHIKDKFPEADALFASFYECDNRIAKYLEQLFLDTYDFPLNSAENNGSGNLYAVWDDDRHTMGTEMHAVAEVHTKKIGDGPYEM